MRLRPPLADPTPTPLWYALSDIPTDGKTKCDTRAPSGDYAKSVNDDIRVWDIVRQFYDKKRGMSRPSRCGKRRHTDVGQPTTAAVKLYLATVGSWPWNLCWTDWRGSRKLPPQTDSFPRKFPPKKQKIHLKNSRPEYSPSRKIHHSENSPLGKFPPWKSFP